jgi:hypothetical protein
MIMEGNMKSKIQEEKFHRLQLFAEIENTEQVLPSYLREKKIYKGQQGIYRDKARTKSLSSDNNGVTVSVLHTGQFYPNDIAEELLLYHYPNTNRPGSFDEGEIRATKNTNLLGLPIFVIIYPEEDTSYRKVRLGWVENWDDINQEFYISMEGKGDSLESTEYEQKEFSLFRESGEEKTTIANVRKGQTKFRSDVFSRYGEKCAVCDFSITELLIACHIVPVSCNGSNDPRNGLVLCPNHHAAYDAGLFEIEPESLYIKAKEVHLSKLHVCKTNLNHLKLKPSPQALKWRKDD